MFKFRKLYSFLAAVLFLISNAAQATVYDFGNLLTASYSAPNSFSSAPFAQLSAAESGIGIWTFTLSISNNLFASFGNGAFLGSMSFDFTPDATPKNVTTKFLGSNSDGVTSVAGTNGTGASGLTDIDFGTKFGQGSGNRLSQNDWVSWSVAGLTPGSSLTNMYLHVQGIDGGNSAKYTPIVSPVPEPQTFAMLLSGLFLVGFSARQRKNFVN